MTFDSSNLINAYHTKLIKAILIDMSFIKGLEKKGARERLEKGQKGSEVKNILADSSLMLFILFVCLIR